MFQVKGMLLHRLNQFPNHKKYHVQFNHTRYHYTYLQIFLVAPRVAKYFTKSTNDFVVENYLNDFANIPFNIQEIISCFARLDSLLSSQTEILLTIENCSKYKYFADVFDNNLLKNKCVKVLKTQKNHIFKLSTKIMLNLPLAQKENLKDFKLIVNGQIFWINLEIMCCISDLFLKLTSTIDQFAISIPDEHMKSFRNFMSIFNDGYFYTQQEPLSSLIFFVNMFSNGRKPTSFYHSNCSIHRIFE